MQKIHTNTVIASGVTSAFLAWKVSRTCWSIMPITISTNACSLPGTPAVAFRAA